jgi:hypothetical protein
MESAPPYWNWQKGPICDIILNGWRITRVTQPKRKMLRLEPRCYNWSKAGRRPIAFRCLCISNSNQEHSLSPVYHRARSCGFVFRFDERCHPSTVEFNKGHRMNLCASSIKSVPAADNCIYRARCLKFTVFSRIPTQEVSADPTCVIINQVVMKLPFGRRNHMGDSAIPSRRLSQYPTFSD